MRKFLLLIIGIVVCTYDAFIPQETILSWIGIACCFVALRMLWEEHKRHIVIYDSWVKHK